MVNKIKKDSNMSLIDFVLNFKGDIENNLIPFLKEQNYTSFNKYYNVKGIINTQVKINNTTDIFKQLNVVTMAEASQVVYQGGSFNNSFSSSFHIKI